MHLVMSEVHENGNWVDGTVSSLYWVVDVLDQYSGLGRAEFTAAVFEEGVLSDIRWMN